MTETSRLFGRETELRALAEAVGGVADHGDSLVLLGDAGIGKSSLLQATATQAAAAGRRVLEVVGMEAEAQLPFAGMHQLLNPFVADVDVLPGGQRRALLSALGIEDGPPPEPFLISLAALNLLTHASAQAPLVMLVDDVQWLDVPSHEVLAFLARRVFNDPILIVGVVRKGHHGPFLSSARRHLDLGRLDEAAAREILAVSAADLRPVDRARILREADGNPLALVELPAAWRSAETPISDVLPPYLPLSARLERSFAGRVTTLPSKTRDALLVASVDYDNRISEILAAAAILAGRPADVDALTAAVDAGLIYLDEHSIRFRHPLVRSGILQTESVHRRQSAHAALAEVLVDEPYRRTWHRAHGVVGPHDEVADELEAAHLTSLRRGSVTEAIAALERSAALSTDAPTRGRRLLLAAELSFGLGRADLVNRLLTAASRNNLSELDRARMEWLREIFNDGIPGDATRVFELCDIARRSAQAGNNDLALNLLLGAALRCWWAETGPLARARVAAVTEELVGVDHDPRYLAALAVSEPLLRAVPVAKKLTRIAVEAVVDADALRLLGMAAHAIGMANRSLDFLDRAESKLREQGRLGLLSHVLTMGAVDRIELGEWQRADSALEDAAHLAQETGQPIWNTGTRTMAAMAIALGGDNDRAQKMADDAERDAGNRRLNNLLACVQLARGYGWLSAGQHSRAYHELRRLFDPRDSSYHVTERFHGVMYLAEAAVHADQRADVEAVIAELEDTATTTPSTTLHIHLSYARAVLAPDDEADTRFTDALRQDLVRWPWARARLELAYGAWLRRQRRASEARVPLRSALRTFELIGARSWAEQARTELRATGERTMVGAASPVSVLTAQEMQIARLAAEGLSNKEIGERLYLSPRTVGSHLYRLFPKLDITSRNQLATRLDNA